MKASLLVELFTEELPPRALQKLGEAFAGSVAGQLRAQGLAAPDRSRAAGALHAAPAGAGPAGGAADGAGARRSG